ncbi:hypothetical protein ACJIZ3_022417 [Penstemon smallii]|uniref:Transcription elongation factor n=1 Tax=Penstemon smallii TaxID=265156 RepID=A0ABD3TMH7_9LAMI
MEKELTELFERVKKAADESENSPGEENRCLDALERLKKFPVNYQVLVSTQVGKRLRQLTKHRSNKIKSLASDVVDIWKNIIVEETMKNKKNGTIDNGNSAKSDEAKNIQSPSSVKSDQRSTFKTVKVERTTNTNTPKPDKAMKSETSSSIKIEKSEVVQTTKNTSGEHLHVEKKVKLEKSTSEIRKPASDPVCTPKLASLVYCKEPTRDKIRELLAEALCKVSNEVDDNDDLRERVNECDPYRVAVMVETAMYEKLGKSTGPQKLKYRSIMFNLKDANNPDFRRKVLIGEFEPKAIHELTPEQMASDSRQVENQKLKQKAMFNSERPAAPKASTDQFTCGRCKKKETTYYQLQTRSADEPMTTFVTCVNCNNHWKFC